MKLSNNLKNIRKENNLSQEQLAEKLGVSRQAVSKWESGQSYPEMDKVLLICKLFNYNIDELMNENVKEVNETKQSKVNINKYVEDFFEFITKTVNMLSAMKFKQRMKCLIEQIIVSIFLAIIFAIIEAIGISVLELMFRGLGLNIYYVIRNICEAIYLTLALFVGITILLHIFKIRYLDYYEIVREDDINTERQETSDNQKNILAENVKEEDDENKILQNRKKEKIVIRDPRHSISKFLIGIIRAVLFCIKVIVAFISIYFIFTFICLVALLILSFLFIGTGLVFLGSLFGIISAIIINFIILKLCYNFIISKKTKKSKMAILFLTSLVLAGISIGLICIGITGFNYIENPEENSEVEEVYNVEMSDNLCMRNYWRDIQYIETDSNEVKIVVKHSKYYNVDILEDRGTVHFYMKEKTRVMEEIRQIIKDINNKEIKNYSNHKVYVYTSKDNIEKINRNKSGAISITELIEE